MCSVGEQGFNVKDFVQRSDSLREHTLPQRCGFVAVVEANSSTGGVTVVLHNPSGSSFGREATDPLGIIFAPWSSRLILSTTLNPKLLFTILKNLFKIVQIAELCVEAI